MSEDKAKAWIWAYGSGSLRRACEEGMTWLDMYRHERLAFELCSAAEFVLPSRLEVGIPLAVPDDPATTEACWYARALRWRFAQSEQHRGVEICVRHLRVACVDAPSRAGIGLQFTEFDHPGWAWMPRKRLVIAFVEVDGIRGNPC